MMGKKITAGEGAVVRKGSQFFFKRSTGVHGTGADLDVDTVIGTRSLRWDPIALDLDGNRKISTQAVKSAGKRFDWEQVGYNWSNFNKEKIDWSAVNAEWGTRADRVMKEQGQYRNLADLGLQGTASARSWDRSYSYSYKRNYYSYGRSNYNATYSREYAYDYSRQYGLSRNIQGETLGMGGAYKMKGTRSYSYKYSNDDYTGTSSYTSDSNSFAGRSDRVFSWSQASYSNSYSTSRTTIKQYGRWNLSRYESQGSYKSKGKSVSATNADVTLFSKGGKLFDLNSDSQLDRMTWVGGKDAYLAIDWNSNGRIDNGVELFGARSGDGVRELKFLDTNYDGVVNAKDKDYAKLRLMHADGSLKTLDTQKITEFSVGDRASGSGKGAKRYNRSQTDHGKNTPTAKGNDHSTDGIHDDNGRIGNNGLGPKGKKGKSGAVPSVTVGAGAEKVTGTEFYFRRKDGSKGIAVDVNLDTVMGMRRSEENAQIRRWWAANFRTTRRRIDPIALDMDGDKHISTS
ncbi:MAG: hypothetical protein JKX97_01610, partial [Candidatus Lindowbacteria bacterium]|nr:hypothetical protein [Candidatus Lindowbacteria bacterium]